MTTRRRVACVTMVRDETLFLPIWYKHYAKEFGAENLFVLDHKSDPPVSESDWATSLDSRPSVLRIAQDFPYEPAFGKFSFLRQRFRFITSLIEALLVAYDVVIFGDTDEIFVVDPAVSGSLRDWLDTVEPGDAVAIGGMGLNVLHHPDDALLSPTRPVLTQRRHYVTAPLYAKPHIFFRPTIAGPHGVRDPWALRSDVFLIHLRFADREHLAARQSFRRQLYNAGMGGETSLWKAGPGDTLKELHDFLSRPEDAGDLPHRALLHDFDVLQGAPLIGDRRGPKRVRNPRLANLRLCDFMSDEDLAALAAHRYVLPDRFATASA